MIPKKNDRVRVLPTKPDGTPHPHAGKTGRVLEVMGLVLGPPRVQVKIDDGLMHAGNIMIVSLGSIEKIEEKDAISND